MYIVGYEHAAGLRDPFEARGDVDAITKNIIVVDHDITDVNADAKFDPGILAVHRGSAQPFRAGLRRRNGLRLRRWRTGPACRRR